MAGVTDAPFRVLCASFGGGLFVNQMVTARALVEGHAASWELTRFHPSEEVRSLQLFGTDAHYTGEAVRQLVGRGPGRPPGSELRLPCSQGDPQRRVEPPFPTRDPCSPR
ncbi:MAG: tRNA-dihydrouridine synthase [Microthrixaceae bacterium]|nr:tRNA-dihydrouridine synthase [Microthrixaceae bacterium]